MRRDAPYLGRQQRRRDRRVGLGEGDHPPHFVGELTDVAGPGVEEQVLERLVAQGDAPLALLVAELLQVVLEERRDFLAAFAQRRQVQRQNLEAIEEVFAEAALRRPAARGWRWWRR